MGFPISGPHREKIGSISRDPCNFHLFISNIFMQTRQKILSSLFSKGLYNVYVMKFYMIDDSVPILDIFVHVYIVFLYEYVFPFEFVFSICAFLTFYSTGIPFQIYLYLYIVLYLHQLMTTAVEGGCVTPSGKEVSSVTYSVDGSTCHPVL